jgi:hypothetical protein
MMDVLRELAIRDGVPPREENVAIFHTTFLSEIEKRGRVHETGMLARYKLRTKNSQTLFSDAVLGCKFLKRGKLRILPARVRRMQEISDIFEASRKAAARKTQS